MRKNFADVLKNAKIDIKIEYQKLYGMLYDRSIQVSDRKFISAYDEVSDAFTGFYFRGTCLSIEDFNNMYGFCFEKEPIDFTIDYLVSFCEYIYSILVGYKNTVGGGFMPQAINVEFYWAQILLVIEKIGYMQAFQDNFTIFVEKSPAAIAVSESELIPDNLSYKLISYNHHLMKGQIDAKKAILLQLASLLEGKRQELKRNSPVIENDLFYIFNNLNLRHNNVDPQFSKSYKLAVAKMTKNELEYWYDECYQMCLLAFLELEQAERKQRFDDLKSSIESTK